MREAVARGQELQALEVRGQVGLPAGLAVEEHDAVVVMDDIDDVVVVIAPDTEDDHAACAAAGRGHGPR
jgi:hypothetical protein